MKNGRAFSVVATLVIIGVLVIVIYLTWSPDREIDSVDTYTRTIAKNQRQIDSLNQQIEYLQEQLTEAPNITQGGSDDYVARLRAEIEFLRAKVRYDVTATLRQTGVDSISFFISMLGDSAFVSHYGDFDQPTTWYIASERLGMMGRPAIAPLMKSLSTAKGFALEQTLYALMLAAQNTNVTPITGGDYPQDPRFKSEYAGMSPVEAWRAWYAKYREKL